VTDCLPFRKALILSDAFSENEIKEAIFKMEHSKVYGPDGFPAKFYQQFWDIIKLPIAVV
jgi:hypothetical protein